MTQKTQQLIERFNRNFPVGSQCWYRSVGKDPVKHVQMAVRSAAYDSNGMAVVFFEGKSGYYSIEPQFVDYSRPAPKTVAA